MERGYQRGVAAQDASSFRCAGLRCSEWGWVGNEPDTETSTYSDWEWH